MIGRRALPVVLLLSSCAESDAPVVVRSGSLAIVGGAADDGDPHVVALVRAGRAGCTGTLISPHVVVTAAHCVEPTAGAPAVFFGNDVKLPGRTGAVSYVRRHPGFDAGTLANDLAVLVLEPASTIAPAQLMTVPLDPSFVQKAPRVVGFGRGQGAGLPAGRKMEGTTSVAALFPSTFTARPGPAQPCEGDSGGPAFLRVDGVELLVGVTSNGDADCIVSATFTRVDPFVSFLQAYVDATARPAELGSRCFHGDNCVPDARCTPALDDVGISYCSKACTRDTDCARGMLCAGDGASPRMCRLPTPTPGALGSRCTTSNDCESALCSSALEGEPARCTVRCFPENAPPCPSGFSCEASPDKPGRSFCSAVQSRAPDSGCSASAASRAGSVSWTLSAFSALAVFLRYLRRRAHSQPPLTVH